MATLGCAALPARLVDVTFHKKCLLSSPLRLPKPEVCRVPRQRPSTSTLRDKVVARVGLEEASALLEALKGGSGAIGAYLEGAPPISYLLYLLGAGFGLPFSEDALVVWIASRMIKGHYGSLQSCTAVLVIVYFGIVVSDMVTYFIGVALKMGFFKGFKKKLFRNDSTQEKAEGMVRKWSGSIGMGHNDLTTRVQMNVIPNFHGQLFSQVMFVAHLHFQSQPAPFRDLLCAVQRFCVGFRGPLCLVCGFMGVSSVQFLRGVGLAAPITMILQFFAGYILKDCGNAYLAALALVAGPNLIGHIVGPLLTGIGIYFARKGGGPSSSKGGPHPQVP